ncbi:Hypothetical predicted protein [Scomber scombrus]|uniref:Uncharacterized protein n=1 Tax=Scomber scombrus TaxID=13677 RepID=A0AAV1PH16_SCOSC
MHRDNLPGGCTGRIYREDAPGESTGRMHRENLPGGCTGSIYREYLPGVSTGRMHRGSELYRPQQHSTGSIGRYRTDRPQRTVPGYMPMLTLVYVPHGDLHFRIV